MSFLGKVAKKSPSACNWLSPLFLQFARKVGQEFGIQVQEAFLPGSSNHDGTFWRRSHALAPPDLATG